MEKSKKYALAIHGGAGTILKSAMTAEMETQYRSVLLKAIQCGEEILRKGESAVAAVEAAVCSLEDCELFNAGKGAVYNHSGGHEMDASIMDGRHRKAGAVAGVQRVKNPIKLCRKVMDHSEHVFLLGEGAEAFAAEHGLEIMDSRWFDTEFRKRQWLRIKDTLVTQLDHTDQSERKHGTVGAVALDNLGHLAAATSTGGITNKRYMRVGDSPIIGAGTYAENGVCAVSATGHGEYFIRSVAAYEVAALMKHGRKDLHSATHEVIFETIPGLGGDGGLIAIDAHGNIAMPFNTKGMYRAYIKDGSKPVIQIYEKED